MSATVACPHPARCGARSQEVGSKAHLGCATSCAPAAVAPLLAPCAPPPPASGVDTVAVVAAELTRTGVAPVCAQGRTAVVEALLDGAHADDGWTPSPGRVHPTGGWAKVQVQEWGFDRVRLIHFDADGVVHRADGPSLVYFDAAGAVAGAVWTQHGAHHREDGPAVVGHDAGVARAVFGHRDLEHDGVSRRVPLAAYLAALADGCGHRVATSWAHLALAGVDQESLTALRAADVAPDAVLGAWLAGVRGVEDLAAVATGAVPASWAATGA